MWIQSKILRSLCSIPVPFIQFPSSIPFLKIYFYSIFCLYINTHTLVSFSFLDKAVVYYTYFSPPYFFYLTLFPRYGSVIVCRLCTIYSIILQCIDALKFIQLVLYWQTFELLVFFFIFIIVLLLHIHCSEYLCAYVFMFFAISLDMESLSQRRNANVVFLKIAKFLRIGVPRKPTQTQRLLCRTFLGSVLWISTCGQGKEEGLDRRRTWAVRHTFSSKYFK